MSGQRQILFFLLLFFGVRVVSAQGFSTDACMKGNFLEACFNEDFVLGAKSPPPMGYHICGVDLRLGIVADPDKDGWLTGTPKFIGDYVVPGSPLEGWALKVDTNYTFNYPGYKLYGGRYVGRVSTGSKQSIVYQADFKGLEIIQTAIIDVDKLYILIDVKLKNTGTTKLKDIFYSRFVDPDNEQCLTADFATKMKIDNQLPNLRQHVTVSSVGKTYNSYCALHTRDCRARVVIDSTGLYGVTFYPDSLYNALPGSSRYLVKEGDTITGDKGMALI
ncbi:MAG: hypothetical protein JNL13_02880, partial [Chitinophagaceae bacterium]|nr:hypothetical protein [Chitinophagaceae bacterium]